MIARALLHDPTVLFLDEPTRGLDPIAARELRETSKKLSQNGKTILLTTHLLEEADQSCERVAFIVNGQFVANDTPQNLKLAHGKRSLDLTLPDPQRPAYLSQLVLNMDDAKDQHQPEHLLAEGNVRAIHSQEATLEEGFSKKKRRKPCGYSWSHPLLSSTFWWASYW
jgi:ABC-2 type transport system ATP-binding protein